LEPVLGSAGRPGGGCRCLNNPWAGRQKVAVPARSSRGSRQKTAGKVTLLRGMRRDRALNATNQVAVVRYARIQGAGGIRQRVVMAEAKQYA